MVKPADLTTAMAAGVDPLSLMQRVTERTLEVIAVATGVMVGLADEGGVTYVTGAGTQVAFPGTRVELGGSLSGVAVMTGEIQRSDNTYIDPRVDADACRRLGVISLVCVPLTRWGKTIGVLAVNASTPHAFTDEDVATLDRLADFVSVAIGSATEIAQASSLLLELQAVGDDPLGLATADRSSDSRYVLGVLNPDSVIRMDSSERIQAVLDHPEVLSIAFQPIVELSTNKPAAVEALSRFALEPRRTPDLWFQEADACDRGVELELFALDRALAYLPLLPPHVDLTVNAGPHTAMSEGFHDRFPAIPAGRVVLELTEHAVVDDYPELIASLRTLRRGGLRIAIDDTGSGYSSLAHILKLAPDFIKLDRELTSGIDLDPVRRALASSLVSFAAETGAHIIAEGIETADELDILRDLGIRYGQGYHLGRPGPLESFDYLQR